MSRFPLALTIILSLGVWPHPSRAQDIRQVTLTNCLQGMEKVTAGHAQLAAIPQFYRTHAQQGSAFKSESKGPKFSVVALTEVEMAHQRRANLFEFDPAQSRLYLMAVPMTETWTGLGCLHETVFTRTLLESAASSPSRVTYLTSKVKAFQAELTAADHLTRGAFTRTLRQVQAQRRYHISENIITPNARAKATLDRVFPQPAVLSPHERGLRDDFYMVALNFARLPDQAQRMTFLDSWYE